MEAILALLLLSSPVDSSDGGAPADEAAPCTSQGLADTVCQHHLATMRGLVQESRVDEAFEYLGKLNDSLGLFRPPSDRCWGTLNGGTCTVDQSTGQRTRDLYSRPEALTPRWASWSGLVAELDAARREAIEKRHLEVRAALAANNPEGAATALAKATQLGDDDERLATEVREAEFAAQGMRLLEGPPTFEENGVRWYGVPVYNPRVVPLGNKCKELFGDRAERSALPYRDERVRCSISESRALTDEELAAAREALRREEKRPPTNRRPTSEVWLGALPVKRDALSCPVGMRRQRFVDSKGVDRCLESRWEHRSEAAEEKWTSCTTSEPPKLVLECEAFMSKDDYCPAWKFDGSTCLAETCVEGTLPLAERSDNLLKGCFRCPIGELDLIQTAAAVGQDWNRLREARREHSFRTLYCRVSPNGGDIAPTAKQPQRAEERKARGEETRGGRPAATCDGYQGAKWGMSPGAFRKAVKTKKVAATRVQDVSEKGSPTTMLGFVTMSLGEKASGVASFGSHDIGFYSVLLHWTELANVDRFVDGTHGALEVKYGPAKEVRETLRGLFEGQTAVTFIWALDSVEIRLRQSPTGVSLLFENHPLKARAEQQEL